LAPLHVPGSNPQYSVGVHVSVPHGVPPPALEVVVPPPVPVAPPPDPVVSLPASPQPRIDTATPIENIQVSSFIGTG
jgi:hypothetical protein